MDETGRLVDINPQDRGLLGAWSIRMMPRPTAQVAEAAQMIPPRVQPCTLLGPRRALCPTQRGEGRLFLSAWSGVWPHNSKEGRDQTPPHWQAPDGHCPGITGKPPQPPAVRGQHGQQLGSAPNSSASCLSVWDPRGNRLRFRLLLESLLFFTYKGSDCW